MKRRTLIRTTGAASVVGLTALAGCSGSNEENPPRKSSVVEKVELDNSDLRVNLKENQWVMTRKGSAGSPNALMQLIGIISPVGVASAKGRGSTGRGASRGGRSGSSGSGFKSAPKTSAGRARYGGGTYVPIWYSNHKDDVDRVPVEEEAVAVSYLGDNETFREQDPGPGPVGWDEVVDNSDGDLDGNEVIFENMVTEPGWYRVGTKIRPTKDSGINQSDMGWESIDIRVEEGSDGLEVTERWKVSPRI